MRPADESRAVLLGAAIGVVILLLFGMSLGAVVLVSWTPPAEGSVAATLPSPVATLAPSQPAAQTGEPGSTPDQLTPASPATSTKSNPTAEPSTPPSTHTTGPLPPPPTATPPTAPVATPTSPPPPPHATPTPSPIDPRPSESIVTAPTAFVYDGPSVDSSIIGGVERDDKVVILGSRGTWYLIRVTSPDSPRTRIEGGQGWIAQNVVRPPSHPVPVITP